MPKNSVPAKFGFTSLDYADNRPDSPDHIPDPANANLTRGLVGYWPLRRNFRLASGAIRAVDYSGNGNHGVVNGPVITSNIKLGNNGTYDGVSNYITAGHASTLQLTKPLTISAWAVFTDVASAIDCCIIGKNNQWSLRKSKPAESNFIDFFWGDGTSIEPVNYSRLSSSFAPSVGVLYHVVAKHDGTNLKIKINNELKGSRAQANAQTANANDVILGGLTSAAQLMKGGIAEVRLYNRATTDAEDTLLYESGSKIF